MNKEIFFEEVKKLKTVKEKIEKLILKEKNDIDELHADYLGEVDELRQIVSKRKRHLLNLKKSLENPYFARIDFVSENGNKSRVYIGKKGIKNDDEIIVTDWRAPISSLYYDSEIGQTSYNSPVGIVKGDLQLKRQYDISNGVLQNYFDVSLVSSDQLLQDYLNRNNDSRLKSIVSTIQKEQNEVIRMPISENLIVQGVAGSGKTTVALHRIAYLVYNYINTIKQSEYLVLGPNDVFIKYIKSVLPDLDVSEVKQMTFEKLAINLLDEKINYILDDSEIDTESTDREIIWFKNTLEYKKMIDRFMQDYFSNITNDSLKIGEFVVLEKETIARIFNEAIADSSRTLSNAINITIERLMKEIEKNYAAISSRYNEYCFETFNNAKSAEEKSKIRKQLSKGKIELEKYCNSAIKKYFGSTRINVLKLYKLFINNIENYNETDFKKIKKLKKTTLLSIKNNCYKTEDLISIVYMLALLSPNKELKKIKHVVLDEAQDFGPFAFLLLKKLFSDATFSVFGDLAQSIYSYKSIDNWDKVSELMFNGENTFVKFNKSYRTTNEIMEVADDISESMFMGRSEATIRHGDGVIFKRIDDNFNQDQSILELINIFKAKGYKTIAIISKTDQMSKELNSRLKNDGLDVQNITADNYYYENGVCTVSNNLAKGLEFDAVIISDASEEIYSSEEPIDLKLLYVACTRALHSLAILHRNDLTKVLSRHESLSFDNIRTRKKNVQ